MSLSEYDPGNFTYDTTVLINLFLLCFPWLLFCFYAVWKKNFSFFLLGVGLFFLFIKEWMFMNFRMENLSLDQIFFWEFFFLFMFVWLIARIYRECEIPETDYFFPEKRFHLKPFSRTLYREYNQSYFTSNIFSSFGGGVFILLFYSSFFLLFAIRIELVQSIVGLVFVFMLIINLEKRFFYWEKDYAYTGVPWTQPEVVRPFRLFYRVFSIAFLFLSGFIGSYFYDPTVFEQMLPTVLPVFALIKTIALFFLFFFLYRLLVTTSKVERSFLSLQAEHRDWVQSLFTPHPQNTVTSKGLERRYPDLLFPQTQGAPVLAMLQYLAALVEKTNSDWVYLYDPHAPQPEKRLVASRLIKSGKNSEGAEEAPLRTEEDFHNLSPEDCFVDLDTFLESRKPLLYPPLQDRSTVFKKKFTSLFHDPPVQEINSLIVYPFSYQDRTCVLFLSNPDFDHTPLMPSQKDLLDGFVEQFSQVNFAEGAEAGETPPPLPVPEPVTESPEIEPSPSLPVKEDLPTSPAPVSDSTTVEKKGESPESPLPSETSSEDSDSGEPHSLFPSTQKINDFVVKTNLAKTYYKNSAKVNHLFRPAHNRNSDKIIYKITPLYEDLLQSSVGLVTNTGRKGKLFVFNEISQAPSVIAATNLDLQNLFYSYLSEKKVETFIDEWQGGFKPFSSKDVCQCLALQFNPEYYRIRYINAGINHAYHFDSEHGVFTSLQKHQSQIFHHGEHKNIPKHNPTELDLRPHDLIVIFSDELFQIKNRSEDPLTPELLFANIRKNKNGSPKDISEELVEEINRFAYTSLEKQQIIFIAQVLR